MKKSLTICLLKYCILLLILLPLISENTFAQKQGLSSDGKDFYIGYVYPSFNKYPSSNGRDVHGFFGVYALITSYDNNQVTVSYFDPINGNPSDEYETQKSTYSVFAKQSIQIPLSTTMMQMSEPGDSMEYKACHITSKKPISVQYFSTGANSGGSYLALPTQALGQKFVVASYHDNPGEGAYLVAQKENAGGFFEIIAAFNSTKVTITPSGFTAGGHKPRIPYSKTLNRGQCYWVKGDGSDPTNDLSGSIITSDKPISVLAGHEDAFINSITLTIDARNLMIQQLIPAEHFASDGYVSIPLQDSQPTDINAEGYGENYRVFTMDSNTVELQAKPAAENAIALTTSAFIPAKEIEGKGTPIEFHSIDEGKFSVMLYDRRQQSLKQPYPSPSMMSIIPMSSWKNSFLFYVPANTFEILQNYYINLIAERDDIEKGWIKFSVNGAPTLSKVSSFTPKAKYNNIPYHPELEGVTLSISPGAYYFINTRDSIDRSVPIDTMLRGAFMIYHYGMRALDPDRDFGDYDGDDFVFEFASPIGLCFPAGQSHLVVKVDTFCDHWHICVHDAVPILSATLIDDRDGNVYGRPGKVYKNVSLDSYNNTDIIFNGIDTSVCFNVYISNPLDTGYAPLYILNKNGYHYDPILELRYKPWQMSVSVLPDLPKRFDTLLFPTITAGDEACSTLVYINTAPKGGKSIIIGKLFVKDKTPSFTVKSTSPMLPTILFAGDTLKAQICFSSKDTGKYEDSLVLTTDCFNVESPVLGKIATPLIYASDWDFGEVTVGASKCNTVTITNRGSMPFLLTKGQFTSSVFTLDPNYATRLPHTLKPGESIVMGFCYAPKQIGQNDSARVDWVNDIDAPFKGQIKSWSLLTGTPIQVGLIWNKKEQFFRIDSLSGVDSIIERVRLMNNSRAIARNVKVSIAGVDATEFRVTDDSLGFLPLENFDMRVGQIVWVDILFKPNVFKPARFADRHAILKAEFSNELKGTSDSVLMSLTGTWAKSGVKKAPDLASFSVRPNPVSGNSIILTFPANSEKSLVIFDMLGREMLRREIASSVTEMEIPIGQLENGIYYARINYGGTVLTRKFEIMK
jgi:hypothetical protein